MNEVASAAVEWGVEASLEGRRTLNTLSSDLPTVAADLLEVAASAHVLDRQRRRSAIRDDPYTQSWPRELQLGVRVRQPERWKTESVLCRLTALLDWVSDDHWDIDIQACTFGPLDNPKGFLFPTPVETPARIALLSGGLDSALGLCRVLQDERETPTLQSLIAVSITNQPRLTACQRAVVAAAGRVAGTTPRIVPLTFNLRLHGPSVESSQRTRGILFLAAGIASALATRQPLLEVWENGIGAMNLPIVASQVGSMATRAVHPRTLKLLNDLLTALEAPVRVDNPYLGWTKAAMVRTVDRDFDEVLAATASCDSAFSHRQEGPHLCGRCTSCLLRRQSLIAGGRSDLDERDDYRHDYRTHELTANDLEFTAVLWHLANLKACLRDPDPWRALMLRFPILAELPDPASHRNQLLKVYRDYVQEWTITAPALNVDTGAWELDVIDG
jgi:hypothetical protein